MVHPAPHGGETMRTLTNAELIDNATKALDGGILAAKVKEDNPDLALQARYMQTYGDKGRYCVCAIGASLTPAEVMKAGESPGNSSCSVNALAAKHVVVFEDHNFADKLQNAHDGWLDSLHDNAAARLEYKATFYKLIGRVLPEKVALMEDFRDLLKRPGAVAALTEVTGLDRSTIMLVFGDIDNFLINNPVK